MILRLEHPCSNAPLRSSAFSSLPRIALVVPSLTDGGGVPAVAKFLLRTILDSGRFEVKLISLACSSSDADSVRLLRPDSWLWGVRAHGGEWQNLPYTQVGIFGAELEFQRYRPRPLLRRLLSDCDLVQVVSGSPACACAVADCGRPIVLQVATRAIIERRRREQNEHGLKGLLRKAMTRITNRMDVTGLRSVNVVMVENSWMQDYCSRVTAGYGVEVHYAPPGVDVSVFRPKKAGAKSPHPRPYLLSVGRFSDPRKNIGLLLRAYMLLVAKQKVAPDLLLAGASSPEASFWRQVVMMGLEDRVHFWARPSQDELVTLYQHADCFVLSSDEEGFGVVVIEALACGTPVVATRCGGPEGIITDGQEGWLVPLNDPEAFADCLLRVLSLPVSSPMRRTARKTAVSRYSEEVTGATFLSVYEHLLARRIEC